MLKSETSLTGPVHAELCPDSSHVGKLKRGKETTVWRFIHARKQSHACASFGEWPNRAGTLMKRNTGVTPNIPHVRMRARLFLNIPTAK
ncbi:hypothetical protein FHX59_002556 [Paraburkholderia silvatlantica]|uniref:Uncharacterized protein n=1 Tax=Paraburkholderia silvatlantica TaxID=321895 RepID=A0ABR6FL36_9BURK|nr:hypothetical protein [Paraburkholderia silvatlantica]